MSIRALFAWCERQGLVNAILWSNYPRLRDALSGG